MSITLIGYRGTGKSTVARLLADRLAWQCVDSDCWIEQRAGRSIREIFETEGEGGFRDREQAAIAELTRCTDLVVAAGGGAVLRVENRRAIRTAGPVIWLMASPQVIAARIHGDPTTRERRPALTRFEESDEIQRLLAEREPLYRDSSDLAVDTDCRSPQQVADHIMEAMAGRLAAGVGRRL